MAERSQQSNSSCPTFLLWVQGLHRQINTPVPDVAVFRDELHLLEWKRMEDARRQLERAWLPRYGSAMEKALHVVREKGVRDVMQLPEYGAKVLVSVLRPLIWETYLAVSHTILPRVEEYVSWKASLIDPMFVPYIREVLDRQLAQKITGIEEATKTQIRNVLVNHFRNNDLNVENIIRDLSSSYAFSRRRGELVGRTEIVYMSNAVMHHGIGVNAVTYDMLKDWSAVGDERTRPTHLTADASQRNIPFNFPFEVGDSRMMFPGDSSLGAPGRETIQCRCTVMYHRPRRPKPPPTPPPPPEPPPPPPRRRTPRRRPKPGPPPPPPPAPAPTQKPRADQLRDKLWEKNPDKYYERIKENGAKILNMWIERGLQARSGERDYVADYREAIAELRQAIASGNEEAVKIARQQMLFIEKFATMDMEKFINSMRDLLKEMPREGGEKPYFRAISREVDRNGMEKFRMVVNFLTDFTSWHSFLEGTVTLNDLDAFNSRRRTPARPFALGNSIYLSKAQLRKDYNSVAMHEFGHFMEANLPHVWAASKMHYRKRTVNERPVALKVYNRAYGDHERTNPDKFVDPYMGKIYDGGETEIVSMVCESFSDRSLMNAMLDKDRETLEVILGALTYGRAIP